MFRKIVAVIVCAVFDSRGNLTVKVDFTANAVVLSAVVSSRVSTDINETLERRDYDSSAYLCKETDKAVAKVEEKIRFARTGMDAADQLAVDAKKIELDGSESGVTKNSCATAIFGVSIAVAKAGAIARGVSLYKHLNSPVGNPKMILLVPSMNVTNGSGHASNNLSIQEFLVLPVGATSFLKAMKIAVETYQYLKAITIIFYLYFCLRSQNAPWTVIR